MKKRRKGCQFDQDVLSEECMGEIDEMLMWKIKMKDMILSLSDDNRSWLGVKVLLGQTVHQLMESQFPNSMKNYLLPRERNNYFR